MKWLWLFLGKKKYSMQSFEAWLLALVVFILKFLLWNKLPLYFSNLYVHTTFPNGKAKIITCPLIPRVYEKHASV